MSGKMKKTVSLVVILVLVGALMCVILAGENRQNRSGADQNAALTQTKDNPVSAAEEFRAVWMASVYNIDLPNQQGLDNEALKSQIDAAFERVTAIGMNAVVVQVRPNGDALYPSELFPWSHWLTGEQGRPPADGFDPLAYMIEAAHQRGLQFHAWVNPYRITAGSKTSVKHDLSALSQDNPARLHPEYVVAYDDGCLYYNPGIPEVQTLIIDGIRELVDHYAVDGIHMDDYFYPYKVYTEDEMGQRVACAFDDGEAYAAYGEGKELDDWRRDNVTAMIRGIAEVVKQADHEVAFGVSPFGIWANASSTEGGSQTNAGFESYYDLYADTRSWVKEGYLDYICPQVYWGFGNEAAAYETVCDWWNEVAAGTDTKLYIGHAAYKMGREETGFNEADQLVKQVRYARELSCYGGSIFYNYSAFEENTLNITQSLTDLYHETKSEDDTPVQSALTDAPAADTALQSLPAAQAALSPYTIKSLRIYRENGGRAAGLAQMSQAAGKAEGTPIGTWASDEDETDAAGEQMSAALSVALPQDGYVSESGSVFLAGTSDPQSPLRINGRPVVQTASGYFNDYLNLTPGENRISLQNGAKSCQLTLWYAPDSGQSGETTAKTDQNLLSGLYPDDTVIKKQGEQICFRALAPAGSEVTVNLAGEEIPLTPALGQQAQAGTALLYEARYTLPKAPSWGMFSLGTPLFTLRTAGKQFDQYGAGEIFLLSSGRVLSAQIADGWECASLSAAGTYSPFYFPLYAGMRDYVLEQRDGMCRLSCGIWVNADRLETEIAGIRHTLIESAILEKANERKTVLRLKNGAGTLVTFRVMDDRAVVTLYHAQASAAAKQVQWTKNPLFTHARVIARENQIIYLLRLSQPGCFYGYEASCEGGDLLLTFRNPLCLAEKDKPLAGITIALDAGHGGDDPGALGPGGAAGVDEAQLNRMLSDQLCAQLKARGAKVVTLHAQEEAVDLRERVGRADAADADLCLSLHQNSTDQSVDVRRRRGMDVYYFYDFCAPLGRQMLAGELPGYQKNQLYRQSLAMCRQGNRPSILIESSYIVNAEDYEWMMREQNRLLLAADIADRVEAYLAGQG